MEPEGRPGAAGARRRSLLRAAGALVALGWVLPAVVTAVGGGFGVPRNDDAAFAGSARVLAEHGTFRLRGASDMTLVGQTVLAWPVARATDSRVALQLATLTIGLAGLVAVAAFAREVLDLRRSVLVALVVTATPLWIPLATSFMTDVWAFALGTIAVALVAAASRAPSTAGFVAGAAAALLAAGWAFLVRQSAGCFLVAVAVGLAVSLHAVRADRTRRRLERTVAAALAAATVAVCGLGYAWRSQWPVGPEPAGALTLQRATLPGRDLDRWLLTLGLLLLPAAVAFGRRGLLLRRRRTRPALAGLLGAVIGGGVLLRLATQPIEAITLIDYASRAGPAAYSGPPERIAIVPWPPWALLVLAAAANLWAIAVVLTGPWLRRCWRANAVVCAAALALVVSAGGLIAASWVAAPRTFDRYLLPVIPYAALLLAWAATVDRPAARPSQATSGRGSARFVRPALFGGLVALSAWFGLASASFDRATFDAASSAAERFATDPSAVDGGLTWNAYQRDAQGSPTETIGPASTLVSPCIELRQSASEDDVPGTVVLHRRLLWVDRWYGAVKTKSCPRPSG